MAEIPSGFVMDDGTGLPPGFNLEDRPFSDKTADFQRRMLDTMTFGYGDKALAGIGSLITGKSYDDELKRMRQHSEDAGARLGPTAATVADLTGGVVGGAGLSGVGATIAGRLPATASLLAKTAAGAAEGAGYGALQGVGHTDTGKLDDYLGNAYQGAKTGAVVGAAAPAVLGAARRVVTPFTADSAARAQYVATLQGAGVPLRASQVVGSPTLATIESATEKMPFGKLASSLPSADQQGLALAQAAGRSAAIAAPEITEAELVAAKQSIGGRIGSIQGQYHIDGNDMLPNLTSITSELGMLQPGQQGVINHYVNRMLQESIAPGHAQALRTQLTKAINGQNGMNGDAVYGSALTGLKETLDDGLAQAIAKAGKPQDLVALQQARQQYANLHVLQDALMGSGQSGQLGRLTPAALQTAQAKSLGRGGYMQGRGDLTGLAKASRAVLPIKEGSQTGERNLYYRMIADPAKLALGLPANAAINSRPAQAYLANQIMPGPAPTSAISPLIGGILGYNDPRRRLGLLQ